MAKALPMTLEWIKKFFGNNEKTAKMFHTWTPDTHTHRSRFFQFLKHKKLTGDDLRHGNSAPFQRENEC